MTMPSSLSAITQTDDYDANSMPVDQARRYITQFLNPVQDIETVQLRDGLGRVLAADLRSPIDVPGHDYSAMDGWAFAHADLVGSAETVTIFKSVGTAYAGKPFQDGAGKGECVRIFTGAVIPKGCDTVAMQEHVTVDAHGVQIPNALKLGQNKRLRGEDLKVGNTALTKGCLITPAALGLIASLGIDRVTVFRKLRVAFFSTGDELKPAGVPLGIGEIYDSNRHTLYGMLVRAGCEPIDLGHIGDDRIATRNAFITAAAQADVVITSGGVSVGEADFIKQILDELGEVLFWKIAMKPGRPLAYGKLGANKQTHFFGLPGNPVAVAVTFYQFVRSALFTLQGRSDSAMPPLLSATLTTPIKKAPGRTEFQRGVMSMGTSGYEVKSTGEQGSGILSSMTEANCFIVLESAIGNVAAGEMVKVQMFEGLL